MKSLLKNAREQKGLKTRELAQFADIDQALISKFESGNRKPTKENALFEESCASKVKESN